MYPKGADEFLIAIANRRKMFLRKVSYKLIKAINKLFDKRIKHQGIKKFRKCSKLASGNNDKLVKYAQYQLAFHDFSFNVASDRINYLRDFDFIKMTYKITIKGDFDD